MVRDDAIGRVVLADAVCSVGQRRQTVATGYGDDASFG